MSTATDDTMNADTDRADFAEGVVFGPYRIVRVLGRGGMGTVYEATHSVLKKRVALKTLHLEMATNPGARQRFVREGIAASKLDHPHVVSVSDVGVQDGIPYLVMELMAGEDLGSLLEREKALSVERTVEIMVPVCVAVEAAHRAGVIHRDLKPDNIFLAKNALGVIVPKVLDFGISKVIDGPNDQALTGSNVLMGTSYYMSPEQAMGARNADARSDQYTLGVILYECVVGRRPFAGDSLYPVLYAINEGRFDPPRTVRPDLPQRFEAIILRAMNLAAPSRFASCEALAQALLAFADTRTRTTWEPNLGVPSAEVRASAPSAPPAQVSLPPSRPDTLSESAREIDRSLLVRSSRRRQTVRAAAALSLVAWLLGRGWIYLHAAPGAPHATALPLSAAIDATRAAPSSAPTVVDPRNEEHVAVIPSPAASAVDAADASVQRTDHLSPAHRHHHGDNCRSLGNGAFDCS